MRILFVLENYFPHIGGVERVFRTLAEGLVAQGFTVDVVTRRLPNTRRFEILNGVRIHRVRSSNRYLFTFFSLPQVLGLARRADIIHTTTFNGAPPAWLAARLLRKKCVITVHEVWVNRWRELTDCSRLSAHIHNFLEKMIYRLRFDYYACVSQATQKDLLALGVAAARTSVIYNGIDYGFFDPEKYDEKKVRKEVGPGFVYLTYGRPGPSKGIEFVVKAVPQIVKEVPGSKLLLILSKDKAYRTRYESILKLISKLGIFEHVIVHNPVAWEELPAYIKAVDCVVIPSLAEGFGFTAAESCAMGIPVVATNAGSLPEVVSGTHVLVQARDAGTIAAGVVAVHAGKAQKTPLKRFPVEKMVGGYVGVYRKLAEKLI